MTALRNFNGLASWKNAENKLQSVNLTIPLPRLTQDMMEAGYQQADIRGILGENWLRLAQQVWK